MERRWSPGRSVNIALRGVRAPALWYGPFGACKGDSRAWPALAWASENRWSSRCAARACGSIGDGESVQVRRQRLYLPGDVIVVRRRDHWNVHRFLGYAPSVHGLVALTQADDASERDPAALASAIVGRARCDVRASDRLAALGKYARAMILRVAGVDR